MSMTNASPHDAAREAKTASHVLATLPAAARNEALSAMHAALAAAMRARVPDADPAGMIALALGKHGARELNYSSDIDPIILYDPALLPRRERDDPRRGADDVEQALHREAPVRRGHGHRDDGRPSGRLDERPDEAGLEDVDRVLALHAHARARVDHALDRGVVRLDRGSNLVRCVAIHATVSPS